MEVLNTMGIKRRILTSGTKFVKKHLSVYEKLASQQDGSGATDDNVQLQASIKSMALTSASGDGTVVATLVIHGDFERTDDFTVYEDGVEVAVTTNIASASGTPGIEEGVTATWVSAAGDATEISVRVVLDRTASEATGTVTVDGP
jgi:hypothetical protein